MEKVKMNNKHCEKNTICESTSKPKMQKRSASEPSDYENEKHRKRKKKHHKKSTDSESSSNEKKRKHSKHKKKKHKKKRDKEKSKGSEDCFDVPITLMTANKEMTPMTKEEWEKKQSVVNRVFDESTGRYRLIKGDGEVIEEIVSRERHKQINEQATKGDGTYFQSQLSNKLPTK